MAPCPLGARVVEHTNQSWLTTHFCSSSCCSYSRFSSELRIEPLGLLSPLLAS